MKTILFCAGRGVRLGKITEQMPKCLVTINGEPMLKRWMKKFGEWQFSDVLINVGYKSDVVIDYLKDLNWNESRLSIFKEDEPIGTAKTLYRNKKFVKGEYYFGIVYSDVWTTFDVRKMITFHKRRPSMVTLGLHVPKDYSNKGVAIVKDGKVVGFEEKPKNPRSKYVWAGILIAHPSMLSVLNEGMTDIASDLLPELVKSGNVSAFFIDDDPLFDIGESVERYNEIQNEIKNLGLRAL